MAKPVKPPKHIRVLQVTAPTDVTIEDVEGDGVYVDSFPTPTISGGQSPYQITYSPSFGKYIDGFYDITCTVKSLDGQIAKCNFMLIVRNVVAPPISPPPGTHPSIWITPTIVSDIQAKQAASDPDFTDTKTDADNFATNNVPRIKIVAATNSNPVQFTTQDILPWGSGDVFMSIVGGTGLWSAINHPLDSVIATKTGSNTFTIPVNSTTFGALVTQPSCVIFGGESAGYFGYGQTASGWYDAIYEMGIIYRTIGGASYVTKALELLDWISELANAGHLYPTTQDTGRGVTAVLALALGYDWFFDNLSTTQKNNIISAGNLWADWHIANNAYWGTSTAPTSNYWMNNVLNITAFAYATQGENAHAASLLSSANTEWATFGDPYLFQIPDTTPGYNTAKGLYYGGLAVAGFNYGANDISRYIKYFYLIRTATGSDITNGIIYSKRFMNSLIYQLKPDMWKATNWGQWTGEWYGLMTFSEALLLSFYLNGITEGGWAQYMYQNGGWNAAGFPAGATTFAKPATQDRLMYYKSSRTPINYNTQSLSYLSDGGEAIFTVKSDWGLNGDYAYFKCTASHYSASTPRCAAHVDISRGTDYLLVDASYWKGTGDGSNGSPQLSKLTGGAYSNTYYYTRPDGTGPDGFTGETYEGGQLGGFRGFYTAPKYKIDSNYSFCENEFSSIYDFSGSLTDKDVIYFFRSFIYVGNGTYVVWDRKKSKSSGDVKQNRWHLSSQHTPVYDDANRVVSSVVGGSKLYIKPLLPLNPSISVNQTDSAPFRVIVEDPIPGTISNLLTVFFATSSGGSLPTTTLVDTDSNFVGCQISDSTPKIVLFPISATDDGTGNYTSDVFSSCTFITTHAGTGKYVIAGLAVGTYFVRRNGLLLSTIVIGSDGTMTFNSSSGRITITTT